MGKGDGKKGYCEIIKDGFRAVRQLDNGNIYCVMLSEMVSNIFKEGMWFKALTPYMLILSHNDPIQVGNMITLNGLTRAFVGVMCGRVFIGQYGVEFIWVVTGFCGFMGLLINVVCLSQSSIAAAYLLNFVWAIFNGLWNSCLETSWSRSIIRQWREDVNGARQMTNKMTTACGPLISAMIFMYYGNSWDMSLVTGVMLFGTMMTAMPVMLCFCFRAADEVVQDIKIRDIERFVFFDADAPDGQKSIKTSHLTYSDFTEDNEGLVQLTYPIAHEVDHWASRIKIMTDDFKNTNYILAKQFHCSFSDAPRGERTCILVFDHDSRPPIRVDLKSVYIFLTEPQGPGDSPAVDSWYSEVCCQLNPCFARAPKRFQPLHIMSKLVLGYGPGDTDTTPQRLREALVPDAATASEEAAQGEDDRRKAKQKEPTPNILGANVIVVCDVLNALGTGFSLKFMDLFLKVDYGVTPAGIFMIAFFQNMASAWLTPWAKKLLNVMRKHGYRAKLGVVVLWCCALVFLTLICLPGMPLWVVAPSIVLMQSLNSCTRAYNRASLINYLPREKVPVYMAWDALNKANQGGIAIFGAQVVAFAGYRGCFVGTLIIHTTRMLIYLGFTLRKGGFKKVSKVARSRTAVLVPTVSSPLLGDVDIEAMNEAENIRGGEDEDSQLFQPSASLASSPLRSQRRGSRLVEVESDEAFNQEMSRRASGGGGTPGPIVAGRMNAILEESARIEPIAK